MSKKSKKIEKETRRLIESISDVIRKKGDRYKFKTKDKKLIKKIKKTCPHWKMDKKGNEKPAVEHDPERPGYWRCKICKASFPIRPQINIDGDGIDHYKADSAGMLQLVNQMQFWSVKLGGDASDTKMFTRLKSDIPRFIRVSKEINKRIAKHAEFDNRRKNTDAMAQFSQYNYSYRQ